ncbi:MAG: hypothetical protein AB7T31_07720 [Gemmatimonadales bacterium]
MLAALLVGLTACEDPLVFPWDDQPDTVRLFSLARPEPNLPSGFGFHDKVRVQVEQPNATGLWDLALDTEGASLVLKPPGALGITTRAGIATLGDIPFADVTEAPGDTLLYELDGAVPVTAGTVYAIRTNRQTGSFGSTCVFYAKMQPLSIDVGGGELQFQFVSSPVCNNRSLVSPEN